MASYKVVKTSEEEAVVETTAAVVVGEDEETSVAVAVAVPVHDDDLVTDLEMGGVYSDQPKRPKYCSVQFTKAMISTEVGLDVERCTKGKAGSWKITNIESTSPLYDSPIQVGDRVIRVNNTYFGSNATTSPVDFIAASKGSITVLAMVDEGSCDPTRVAAMITKMNRTDKVGVAFRSSNNSQNVGVIISKINPNGLFSQSKLALNDRLISINGEDFHSGGLPLDVVQKISNAERRVTLVVQHAPEGTVAPSRRTTAAVPTGASVAGGTVVDPNEANLDQRDFWLCCCLTAWVPFGCLCAIPCILDRPNAPSRAAVQGWCTAFIIALILSSMRASVLENRYSGY